jgi:hypothetical protein
MLNQHNKLPRSSETPEVVSDRVSILDGAAGIILGVLEAIYSVPSESPVQPAETYNPNTNIYPINENVASQDPFAYNHVAETANPVGTSQYPENVVPLFPEIPEQNNDGESYAQPA